MVLLTHKSQPPNGISIGSAVFAQHISETHRQTHRPRCVCQSSVAIGRILCIGCRRCGQTTLLLLLWLLTKSSFNKIVPWQKLPCLFYLNSYGHLNAKIKSTDFDNDFDYDWLSTCSVLLFCFVAVLDPRVGNIMSVLSPFISVLCHSEWLPREFCLSTYWCCPPRPCVVWIETMHNKFWCENSTFCMK